MAGTLDRVRSVQTKRFKYIRNFHPDRPYSQHSGYKELQYPGMAVARALKQRGELTGAPALFWAERRPAEELYDIVADPEELNNLAGNPAHAKTLSLLGGELERWIEHTDDKGRFVEADVKATAESSDRWYQRQLKKRGLTHGADPEIHLNWWSKTLGLE